MVQRAFILLFALPLALVMGSTVPGVEPAPAISYLAGQDVKTWRLTALYEDGENRSAFLDECDRAELQQFKVNGEWAKYIPPGFCNARWALTTAGRWRMHFQGYYPTLTITSPDFGARPRSYTLLRISHREMRLHERVEDPDRPGETLALMYDYAPAQGLH